MTVHAQSTIKRRDRLMIAYALLYTFPNLTFEVTTRMLKLSDREINELKEDFRNLQKASVPA